MSFNHYKIRFHWKFWQPLDAFGGKVWFGVYYLCQHVSGVWLPHTSLDWYAKDSMGLWDDRHY